MRSERGLSSRIGMHSVKGEDDFGTWPYNRDVQSHANRRFALLPEKQLLAAILERAALDATTVYEWSLMHQGVSGEAKGWFGLGARFSQHSADHPFSFEWICAHLDLDAVAVREKVREYVRNKKRLLFIYSPVSGEKCTGNRKVPNGDAQGD